MVTFSAIQEMHSFVAKFNQLAGCGINSCLSFNSYNGKLFVNMTAEIGDSPHQASSQAVPPRQYENVKPSRIRRRKRREQLRRSAETNLYDKLHTDTDTTETEKSHSNTDEFLCRPEETFQHADVDQAVEAFEINPHAELTDPIMLPNEPSLSSQAFSQPPDTTSRSCCPDTCCSTSYSSARNCPGPGVSKTTYIRCCLHE